MYLNNTECMADVGLQPYCDGHKVTPAPAGPEAGSRAAWLMTLHAGKTGRAGGLVPMTVFTAN